MTCEWTSEWSSIRDGLGVAIHGVRLASGVIRVVGVGESVSQDGWADGRMVEHPRWVVGGGSRSASDEWVE